MSWREDIAIDAELAREHHESRFEVEAIGADPCEPTLFAWIGTAVSLELADAIATAHTAATGQTTRVV